MQIGNKKVLSLNMNIPFIILVLLSQTMCQERTIVKVPNLPVNHLQRYFNTFPQIKEQCDGTNCQLPKDMIKFNYSDACWGFESACSVKARFKSPSCPGDHTGWVQSKQAQTDVFYSQADFGYIRHQLNELTLICEPRFVSDSSLECTQYLRFCRGRNLLFDFRDLLKREELIRYHMDVLKPGQILGHCRLNGTQLRQEMEHMGALQSWAPELRNFEESYAKPLRSDNEKCDIVERKPTFIMKIDAAYNMYHHFCDFLNLYMSLFVNQSHPLAFDTDVRILIWETYPYDSPFAVTFKAFTKHAVWTLNDIKGKRVCFQNVVLPLLPRMIFGLYYNTPIIQGCQGSGLFRAFSEFLLHRLEIPFHPPLEDNMVRVTFLLRRTKFRKILNEDALLEALSIRKGFHIRRVSFEKLSFIEQLTIIRNTDILIGMHGAGLTHLLFLPEWASIFELYNCEDPNCYKDLARLRGVHYITWERNDLMYPEDEGHHPQGGAHAKFTNYAFDETEFKRLVDMAADHVRDQEDYQMYHTKHSAVENARDEL